MAVVQGKVLQKLKIVIVLNKETYMTPKPENDTSWIRKNLFSIINLLVIIATFAYKYGIATNKAQALEAKALATEVRNDNQDRILADLVTNGHPAHEARITVLEKKTDDLAVLKNIVMTQSENIKNLTDTVRQDHDILLRYISAAESKKTQP